MKIAIAGYAVEGKENYKYWAQDPSNEITIVDERAEVEDLPEGVSTILGPGSLQQLEGFDMVVRTASMAPYKIKTDGKIWSATNEFFAKCPAPIIGVTGSKGKGTTCSLIASILEVAGKKVWLVGNIGISAIETLPKVSPDDIVVFELSSFQLWDLHKGPHVAVVLYIEQEHLDVHKDMAEYVEAKAQIARHQTAYDVLIFNARNEYATAIAESSPAGHKIGYPDSGAYINDELFYYDNTVICGVDDLAIKGAHNWVNSLAAIDAAWNYTQDVIAIRQGLENFKGLPHRLAYVRTVDEVEYYDDSIATTPTSAVAALEAFPNRPKVIILGGSRKGSDFSPLAQVLKSPHHQDTHVILIGDEAVTIRAALDKVDFTQYEVLENTNAEGFTRRAKELAKPGGVVLLSPSAASFGMFKNYADRGDQFVAAVNAL